MLISHEDHAGDTPEVEAPQSAARFLLAPMLTNWAVHTGSAVVISLSAAMASVLFSLLTASESGQKTH